jgi:adenylylsulfate kinase-like enzyme
VVVSALTANESARELVKTACPNVILGYVRCSLEECMERDPKGLYARAKSGEIDTLIGYNSAYPEPDAPDLILDTAGRDVQVVLEEVLSYLAFQGWLTKDH